MQFNYSDLKIVQIFCQHMIITLLRTTIRLFENLLECFSEVFVAKSVQERIYCTIQVTQPVGFNKREGKKLTTVLTKLSAKSSKYYQTIATAASCRDTSHKTCL